MAEVDLEKMECEMQDESHQLHQCVDTTAAPTVGGLALLMIWATLSCLGDIAHSSTNSQTNCWQLDPDEPN